MTKHKNRNLYNDWPWCRVKWKITNLFRLFLLLGDVSDWDSNLAGHSSHFGTEFVEVEPEYYILNPMCAETVETLCYTKGISNFYINIIIN